MTSRRRLLAAFGLSSLSAAFPAVSQQRLPRVAWIGRGDPAENGPFLDGLREGLREHGYLEGRNLRLDVHWVRDSKETVPVATAVVQSLPEVIVVNGPIALALQKAGTALPVVFGFSGDPVLAGLADSLARPGRNMTGMSFLALDLVGKRLELLKETVPRLGRVAVLADPQHPGERNEFTASQQAAKQLGLSLSHYPVRDAASLEQALAAILREKAVAVLAFPDAITVENRQRIAAAAAKARIPSISGWGQFADSGMLMSYGPNLRDCYRRLAYYVDRILKGTPPASLPVELPTTVEFVVNQRTARAIGVSLPRSLLLRADRVIE